MAQAILPLTNPLASVAQLTTSASTLDSIPPSLIRSLRYNGSLLTQSAGILLRLPQDTIARSIVTFQRFYLGPEGGSFHYHGIRDISAAAVYLTAKLSATPVGPRSVLNVYAYLVSKWSPLMGAREVDERPKDLESFTLTEGEYLSQRVMLMGNESLLLKTLGFQTKTTLPYPLALTYLQTLSLLPSPPTRTSKTLAARTIALLNTALLSPQILYLTHQPHSLAVAAVYLAARQTGIKIGGGGWWEVFDVGREELGFLVVALGSVEGWVNEEGDLGRGCWTVEAVYVEMGREG
ncbi:MAG: hypothetical protein MMC23_001443 [Stictis urceolatum]|nr:hypothetical protein [Stictis urceolata]